MMSFSGDSPANASGPYAERRAVPRYGLIATAELLEPASGVRISGRISEISRKGCYVDLLNTLPIGTIIQVRVSRDQGVFACPGRIIYIQEGMGMGVAFFDVSDEQLKVLDSWLAELAA
ncbi:MAG TPA: PilZ domain-containing protein [Verrucomicrobiae bacterium]|nr:PilZ domain-containing protein [Verrucomicrobiae bacterium]